MADDLQAHKWKSTGTVTLTDHYAYHRELHTNMTRATEKIGVSVAYKHQQVITLLDSIDSTHSDISTHILTIKSDTNGLGSYFESAASHLFKADPVEKSK